MTSIAPSLVDRVLEALDTVVDPELDEPITDLGFVRSVDLDDEGVEVHLRLPTSFCAPNFAYLMASDAVDALRQIPELGHVKVELDDHFDSDKINAGLAADAGYRGTFGHEAEDSLDELRSTFKRKAHTAAMERSLKGVLVDNPEMDTPDLSRVRLSHLPPGRTTDSLLRRRTDIGLSTDPGEPVFVDADGAPIAPDDIPVALRFAQAVRVSIEGNSHFCRGLLATRYDDVGQGDHGPRITDSRRKS